MNPEHINLRAGAIEFRWSDTNQKYELLQWYPRQEGGEYSCVIAFFGKSKEGFEMLPLGRRYQNALVDYTQEVITVTGYAFDLLHARLKVEEAISELMRDASWKQ